MFQMLCSFCVFFIYLFIFDRERQRTRGGAAEREGDTESEAGSGLRAVRTEPSAGLKLTNPEIITRAKVRRSIDGATQASPDVMF